MPNITRINITGNLDERRLALDKSHYDTTREDFQNVRHVTLPEWGELDKIGKPKNLWLLLSPIDIKIEFDNGHFYDYNYKPGFIWDHISKPGNKSIPEGMMGALVHDANFSCHYLGEGRKAIRATNELLRTMCIKAGMSRLRARIFFLLTNSFIGKRMYNKNKKRAFNHGQFCTFTQG